MLNFVSHWNLIRAELRERLACKALVLRSVLGFQTRGLGSEPLLLRQHSISSQSGQLQVTGAPARPKIFLANTKFE